MPSFPTPRPIRVKIDVYIGDVTIVAGDRSDTLVEIAPSLASRPGDVRAAELTAVDFRNDRLTIRGPKPKLSLFGFGRGEAVETTVALPAGSDIEIHTMRGAIRVEGKLGECRLSASDGAIAFDEAASLSADTGRGDIVAGQISGRVDLTTGTGTVRVRAIGGPAAIKNSNGRTEIGSIAGELSVNAASGDVAIGRVKARSSPRPPTAASAWTRSCAAW